MEKEKIDEEFIETIHEIEKSYCSMNKHEKVRIEQWSKKLCQVTANPLWKKNRNKYAKSLLQLVKIGALQEPFTRIPPEGPLPQFNGQLYIHPPRPKSSIAGHASRIPSNSESSKQFKIKFEANTDSLSLEKAGILKTSKALEPVFKNTGNKYDTRLQISSKVSEECSRLKTQIDIFQISEKNLRDELSKKNRKIEEQAEEIESLLRENEGLKAKLAYFEVKQVARESKESFEEIRTPYKYFFEKKRSEDELLNIDDISYNLKRLEKLQEDLNRNKFG